MEISEKVAYLKGLAEGLALDTDTKEGNSGEIRCPKCGEKLEFDLSDLANAKDSEDDE